MSHIMRRTVTGLLVGVGVLTAAALVARSQRERLMPLAARFGLEGPAGKYSYAELAQALEHSGSQISDRLAGLSDSEARRETMRHIIGIERWGQSRLEALQNAAPGSEGGYRPFRPEGSLDLFALRDEFKRTRAHSAELARELGLHPPAADARARHNGLGPLSAKAWLRYLNLHGQLTARTGLSAAPSA